MVGLITYISVLVLLIVLIIKRPSTSLVALLCMFALEQWGMLYIKVLRTHPTLTNIIILILVALAAFLAYGKGRQANLLSNYVIRITSIALLTYAFITINWSPAQDYAYSTWFNKWPYLISALFLVPITIRNNEDLLTAQKYFIYIGGFLLILLATIPKWELRSISTEELKETIALPLSLAQMSGYCLICAAVHFQKKVISIIVFLLILIAALIVVIKSGSRGPLIFMLLTIIIIAPVAWKKITPAKSIQIIFLTSFLILITYFVFDSIAIKSDRWEINSIVYDFTSRLHGAKLLLKEWSSSTFSILFGIGNSGSFSRDILGTYPHIVPLEILGEEGILGFLIYLYIIYRFLKITSYLVKHSKSSDKERKILTTNIGFWLFTLALSLKQGSLISTPEFFLFAALQERLYVISKNKTHKFLKKTHQNAQ